MSFVLPFLATGGLGGILGYGSATFLKTVTKLVGCIIGIIFILMQLLAYYGFAQWNWGALQEACGPAGQVAQSGACILWKILIYNLPFTGGFALGFRYGWKH